MYCVGAVIWAGVQDLDNRCSETGQVELRRGFLEIFVQKEERMEE